MQSSHRKLAESGLSGCYSLLTGGIYHLVNRLGAIAHLPPDSTPNSFDLVRDNFEESVDYIISIDDFKAKVQQFLDYFAKSMEL